MDLLRLAFRNVIRQKRRYVSLVVALGFGFAIMLTINGVSGGMISSANAGASRVYGGNVYILGHQEHPFFAPLVLDDAKLWEATRASGIPDWRVVRRTNYFNDGTLFFAGASVRQKRVVGVEWPREQEFLKGLNFTEGGLETVAGGNGIILSQGVAGKLKAKIGDDILLQGATVTGQRNTATFVLKGIFQDSSIFSYYTSYVDIGRLNTLMGFDPGVCTIFGIFLEDNGDADKIAARLQKELEARVPTYPPAATQVDFWRHFEQHWDGIKYGLLTLDGYLYQIHDIMNAVRALSWVLVVLVLGIVMIGISNTYRVLVHERRKEIGTLRSLGMQKYRVVFLFVAEALIVSVFGMLIGAAIGAIVMEILSLLSFDWIPGFDMFLDAGRFRSVLVAGLLIVNIGAVAFVTFLAALWPARRASRIPAAEALRGDF